MNAKQLRSFLGNLDNVVELEELMLAKNQLGVLDAAYQELGVTSPEWVVDGLGTLSNEIINRNRNELLRLLKTAEARRASLATAEEKRGKLDQDIAALKQKLGVA